MQFSNSFEVSLPPEQAWPLLMNVEAIVPCMPGAELIEKIDERTFKGKVSVKLGPVGLAFICDAKFEEVDDEARTAVIKASGADAKGRGSAMASIDFRCQPCAAGSKILITTDLELSGAVAQYGRGVGLIQNVANQIIGQFARNLEARIAHDKEYGESPQATPEQLATPSPKAVPAVSQGIAGAAAPASGDYAQGYREGFSTGFAAGHAAGYAAAAALLAKGRMPPAAPGAAPAYPAAKPIGGISLMFSSLWATIRGWFSSR
ncbi:carbon monoxide dehydrogenase subunit G [Paracandidimonas soli]|uniref:Carbon monoxide dehydrogenase subunit G n=2 Tax=Paracandidimonas soli TaxID=1917182 RepID=A0A4R3VFX2_9BURK|nr:carbon monoxide dehydrogenase subunit G [Paracandidimonas soli]